MTQVNIRILSGGLGRLCVGLGLLALAFIFFLLKFSLYILELTGEALGWGKPKQGIIDAMVDMGTEGTDAPKKTKVARPWARQ